MKSINIKINNAEKSLGDLLCSYHHCKNAKDKYFESLTENSIFGLVNDSLSSQLNYLGDEIENIFEAEVCIRNVDEVETYDLEKISAVLKKKVDVSTLKKVRTMLDNLKPENLKMRYVKRIYDHIISLHIDQPSAFNQNSRFHLSEQDFQIKFWGPIFEWFFHSAEVVLHWGDTVLAPCKVKKIRFKADLKIVITSDHEEVVDGTTAEVARKAAPRKLWLDKLKIVIGKKCDLNNFLSSGPHLSSKEVKNVVSIPHYADTHEKRAFVQDEDAASQGQDCVQEEDWNTDWNTEYLFIGFDL